MGTQFQISCSIPKFLYWIAYNISLLQGNYDSFVQTKSELDENQQKRYKKEQDEIAHMKVLHNTLFLHIVSLSIYSLSLMVKSLFNALLGDDVLYGEK